MITEQAAWEKAVHVWKTGAHELERLGGCIDRDVFFRTVRAIAECPGRIAVTGVGTSAAAARKIAHSLCCVERPAFFLSPGDAVHGGLGAVQPGDVAVLISKGGGTAEIMNMVPALRTKKAFVVAVTEKEESPLAKNSDLTLKIAIEKEADEFNMLATTSTMAVVAVFDAVAIALMTSLDSNLIHYGEITVTGAFSYPAPIHQKALEIIRGGYITPSKYMTLVLPLEETQQGFEAAIAGKALKVVIKP